MISKLTFEISAVCNARCQYCVTGRGEYPLKDGETRFLTPQNTSSILDYLIKNAFIDSSVEVDLYNWGEPFLNPDLIAILEEFALRGFRYNLSTNGSIYRQLNTKVIKSIKNIYFSFPGFSQASYDRIHGFMLSKIQDNVLNYVRVIREINPEANMLMSFHIYQFNILEMAEARRWCFENGISFFPYPATWNGYSLSSRYRLGKIASGNDLILGYENHAIEKCNLTTYRCCQLDNLTLDPSGRVNLCCVMDKSSPDFIYKDIRTLNPEEVRTWRNSRPVCQECLSLGISQWVFNGTLHNWEELVGQSYLIKDLSDNQLSNLFGHLFDRERQKYEILFHGKLRVRSDCLADGLIGNRVSFKAALINLRWNILGLCLIAFFQDRIDYLLSSDQTHFPQFYALVCLVL